MATYYWVGGSGNWDATSTANWSDTSGGSSGFGPPTSADDVIFDAGSNTGTNPFTVTVTGTSSAPAVCRDFSTGGAGGALDGAMTFTMGATARLNVSGDFTLPSTSLTWSGTSGAIVLFTGNGISKTVTTNGVGLVGTSIQFSGAGSTWTLGSAINYANTTDPGLVVYEGTFSTANYNVTGSQISFGPPSAAGLTKIFDFGSSTITLNATTATTSTNVATTTVNAGTSTITCTATSPTFNGGGFTFYNVTFSSTSGSGTTTINGANTFNNLTQATPSTVPRNLTFGADQTVNGTLTLGASNTVSRRVFVFSSTIGTRRTITLNGTLATLADVDFRDIGAAGTVATPWTGTRLGNCLNNNNITFDAPKTVYWNLAGSQNWPATGWATTNNGTPNSANFPLAQDTAVFTEAGAAGTVTINGGFNIGNIQMADGISNRTTAFTLTTSANSQIYGNVTLFSGLTITGTNTFTFAGQGTTQAITSAGVSFTQSLTVNAPTGTFQLSGNLTNTGTTFTLTAGTLDLNNNTLTCNIFSSNNSNTRTIAFGTGNITVTGNNATVWTTSTATGLTVTGTPVANFTYAGSTGTRAINFGAAGEANAISVNVNAGTDIVALATTNGAFKNINFTGFSGSLTHSNSFLIFGNLTYSSTMTYTGGTQSFSFAATSGTQTVVFNGVSVDRPIIVNAPGATVKFTDALTQGSTRNFAFIAGTLEFAASATSTVGVFLTQGTTPKTLKSTTNGVQATLSQASGTVNATYTTIQDINATGGATWNAFYVNNNVDAGNNTGWNFTDNPINVSEVTMRLRSFTEPRSF